MKWGTGSLGVNKKTRVMEWVMLGYSPCTSVAGHADFPNARKAATEVDRGEGEVQKAGHVSVLLILLG